MPGRGVLFLEYKDVHKNAGDRVYIMSDIFRHIGHIYV